MPEEKRYYMACLDLEGRDVLVVGGGPVALEKVEGLLTCGARVTVVAPEIAVELERLDLTLHRREYRTADLDGRFLVVAATSTTSVNRQVFADAEARGLLCNVVDVPELCSFILPAVHRVDPIAVAISTGGASPRSPSGCVTTSRASSVPSMRRSRDGSATCAPGRSSAFKTYEERRDYFQALVEAELK